MCGIFGFIGSSVDLQVLRKIAMLAANRGPHSWGVSWLNKNGEIETHKEPVCFLKSSYSLTPLKGTTALIGHCRLSTSGQHTDNKNNQPFSDKFIAIAHNGNVYHHRDLAVMYDLKLETKCDSEFIYQALKASSLELDRRMELTWGALGPSAHGLLVLTPEKLFASRSGHPLYVARRPEGLYLCSFQLPADLFPETFMIPGKTVVFFNQKELTMTETPINARPLKHPISEVKWVDPTTLHSNNYNPNRVFSPEMKLLKISILHQGWTQPIVAKSNGEIVDGFHRWTLASHDDEIKQVSGGLCPVVFVSDMTAEEQMAATVRHNRARGQHGIMAMGKIVRSMIESGKTEAEVAVELGMDSEETARLADMRGSADVAGKDNFGQGWVPELKEGALPKSQFSRDHKKDKAQKAKPSRGL